MGGEHERPRPGPEIHEEVDARALDGPIGMAADRQVTREQDGLGQPGPLPVGPPGEQVRHVARRGRRQPAISGEVEQGHRGPSPAAVHEPRDRDVQGAADGAAKPEPPPPPPLRRHAGGAAGPGRGGGSASRRAALPLVAAATVAIGRPRSSATRAAVDRQVGRLVALTAPGLGRQVRAIRLDHERVERQRPHHLGEPPRARVGHRARDRDQEPEVVAAARHLEVAREAVQDPADGGDPLGLADVEEVRVRLPAMEQDGLPDGPRQRGAGRPAPPAARPGARGRGSSPARSRRSRRPAGRARARRSARGPPGGAVPASCGWMPTAA